MEDHPLDTMMLEQLLHASGQTNLTKLVPNPDRDPKYKQKW
ncbi:hypothetical protein ABTD45_19685 [Acinetobacter baumannii]